MKVTAPASRKQEELLSDKIVSTLSNAILKTDEASGVGRC